MEELAHSPLFLAATVAFVVGEAIWRLRFAHRSYDLVGAAASFGVAAGNLLLKPLTAGVIGAVFIAGHEIAPMHLSIKDWRVWAGGFVAVEFVYYWFHRWSHAVRWLWASHAVHHSASEMTFPAAIRLGWTNLISGGWLLFLPLVLIGLEPLMVSVLLGANLTYQFFLHTELVGKLGALEYVLNTPSHHRVHHGANPQYIDKNFGGVLIIFDRLFGTFAEEQEDVPVRYGLVHPLTSKNPIEIALHEWARMVADLRNAGSFSDALRVLFGRPA